MATFYNQATLSFGGRIMNSNITSGEIVGARRITKTAISASYGMNDGVAYAISIINTSATPITGLTVTDDLGAYVTESGITVYPLEYSAGTLKFYVNGILAETPTVVPGPPLTISGITIPAGGNAQLIYEASTSRFAPLAIGSEITNTATVNGECFEDLSASTTVPVSSEKLLTIAKAVCPETVTSCGELSYTFVIQNSGNTAVVATDDVIVSDTFTPILNPISVTFNGDAWTEGVNYTYDPTTGAFTTLQGQITVPSATYTQDPETGVIATTPGVSVITVTGTV